MYTMHSPYFFGVVPVPDVEVTDICFEKAVGVGVQYMQYITEAFSGS